MMVGSGSAGHTGGLVVPAGRSTVIQGPVSSNMVVGGAAGGGGKGGSAYGGGIANLAGAVLALDTGTLTDNQAIGNDGGAAVTVWVAGCSTWEPPT